MLKEEQEARKREKSEENRENGKTITSHYFSTDKAWIVGLVI